MRKKSSYRILCGSTSISISYKRDCGRLTLRTEETIENVLEIISAAPMLLFFVIETLV